MQGAVLLRRVSFWCYSHASLMHTALGPKSAAKAVLGTLRTPVVPQSWLKRE